MTLTSLFQSYYNNRKNTLYNRSFPGDILEDFESPALDEHVIIGLDDGTMVPPIACEFSSCKGLENILAIGDENGCVVLFDTDIFGPRAELAAWQAHSNAIFDIGWVPRKNHLLTASGDQTVVLWDTKTEEKISVFKGHTSSVRTVSCRVDDSAVFASGSRDGHIMIWDNRCNIKAGHISPVNVIRNAHVLNAPSAAKSKKRNKLLPARDTQQSVTVVKFQTDFTLVSSGAVDGAIKFWDLRKSYSMSTADNEPKQIFNYCGQSQRKHGYTSFVMDSYRSNLFASCTDDVIYQYNISNMCSSPVHQYKGHRNSSFYVRTSISPNNQYLLSGSSDEHAYIWQVGDSTLGPLILEGHKAEVSDVAWSPLFMDKIVTLSDDNTMRVWRIHRREKPPELGEVTGKAKRIQRHIGISTTGIDSQTPSSNAHSKLESKEGRKPLQLKSDSSVNMLKSLSPSITSFFKKSTETLDKNIKATPNILGKSCKRKLDQADVIESPSKRQYILKDMPTIPLLSPHKAGSPTVNAFQNHPSFSSESPQKQCGFGSPQKGFTHLSPVKKLTIKNSPVKNLWSPVIRNIQKCGDKTVQSPTMNLPNFVLDGQLNRINVYHKENEPEVNKPKIDWLTQYREQKSASKCRKSKAKASPKGPGKGKVLFQGAREKGENISSQESVDSDSSAQDSKEVHQSPPKGMRSLIYYFKPSPASPV